VSDQPATPEVVYETKEDRAIRSVEEVKALLQRNNALLERAIPLLERADAAGLLDVKPGAPGRPRSLGEFVGQALVTGKFDGILRHVERSVDNVMKGGVPKTSAARRRGTR